MIGLFARQNHPAWGMSKTDWCGQCSRAVATGPGNAHGYVVLAVRCADDSELEAVIDAVRTGFKGIDKSYYGEGALQEWFGGDFDHIGTITGDVGIVGRNDWSGTARFHCYGDNRMFAIYFASEVLEAAAL